MKKRETVLGFQLRALPEQIAPWPPERRRTFALREDVERPLSVDENVWPSIKDGDLLASFFIDPEGPSNGLDLHALRPQASLAGESSAVVVAITAPEPDAERLRRRHRIAFAAPAVSLLRKRGFAPLGWDVADDWLSSGLLNCGFDERSKAGLQERFLNKLNPHGLFQSAQEAEAFRIDCNTRVPEHALFTVYGLWGWLRASSRA